MALNFSSSNEKYIEIVALIVYLILGDKIASISKLGI